MKKTFDSGVGAPTPVVLGVAFRLRLRLTTPTPGVGVGVGVDTTPTPVFHKLMYGPIAARISANFLQNMPEWQQVDF